MPKTLNPLEKGYYSLPCPYCERETQFYIQNDFSELKCPKCSQIFNAFMVTVRAKRGRSAQYGGRKYIIRYIGQEGEGVHEFYDWQNSDMDIRSNDLLSVMYKKSEEGFLKTPTMVKNHTTEEILTIPERPQMITTEDPFPWPIILFLLLCLWAILANR